MKNAVKDVKNIKGFTLIELLVVVLIIGILAAIAVPKYQKAVLKSRLNTGLPLLKSMYDAQQVYKIAIGDFAPDIDLLDISFPKDNNCYKKNPENHSYYECEHYAFGMFDTKTNLQFIITPHQIAYLKFLKDLNASTITAQSGDEFCFAGYDNRQAQELCSEMGGQEISRSVGSWVRYKIVK